MSPARADHFGTGGGGCVQAGSGINAGTLLGGALGGFAGSHVGGGSGRLAATALGVFLGSAIGTSAGSSCHATTRRYVEPQRHHRRERRRHSHRHHQPQQQPYYLQAPVTQIAPPTFVQPVTSAPAQQSVCREYTAEAMIAGEVQPVFGTACLQPDGSWRIVSQDFQY
jgi:surface antigen